MPGMRWEELEHAVASASWERALGLALDGWRDQRKAPLADLVDALSARVPASPVRATGATAFQTAWLSRARQATAADVGALGAALARSLPEAGGSFYLEGSARVRYAAWLERVAAIAELPDDPRTAAALFDVVRKGPWSSYYAADVGTLYDPALALLRRIADERLIERVRALATTPTSARQMHRNYLAEALPALAQGIEAEQKTFRELAASDAERCQRLLDELGAGAKPYASSAVRDHGEHELVELVVAIPDDDDAREVLADLWLERDDPRGRLVALQLKAARNGPNDNDEKVVRRIIKDHEKSWIGDLALVTKGRIYRRGFLDEVELQQNAAADPRVWETAALHPALGTVRAVHKGKANETHYRRFVFSPAARSLRELVVLSKGMLAEACERSAPWPIEHLSLSFMPDKKVLATVRASAVFPSLTRLTLGVTRNNVDKLVALAAGFTNERRVERLSAAPMRWYDEIAPLAAWLSAALGPLAHVPEVSLEFLTYHENRMLARRGSTGLEIEIVATNVYFAGPVVRALSNIERLRMRVPEGTDVSSSEAYEAGILLSRFAKDAVELDASWAATLAQKMPATPRHRDA
jgi:hypothetical protein